MKKQFLMTLLSGIAFCTAATAETAQITMYELTADGNGPALGVITLTDTEDGLRIDESLSGLTPGVHGMHIHENGSCEATVADGVTVLGGAAGGHYDPKKTGKHLGPESDGHMGDLPVLTVKADGTANATVYVEDVEVADFKGRALIIHAGGDNYQDTPKPLGGGGDRIACGIVE